MIDVHSMPCFRCGVCCTKYGVRISFLEARRIADRLGLTWTEFVSSYVVQDGPNPESLLLRRNGSACVFLENTGNSVVRRCLIHPFKPSACKEWSPSLYRRDCQEGLARYWGLRVGSSALPEGPVESLNRFYAFLETLAAEEAKNYPQQPEVNPTVYAS